MKCYNCGHNNPEKANFCLNCGIKLKAPETAERKFATILFADLKEFTPLCEQKDPEEVREIIKELFSRFDGILENFQVGYHEYIGDAVLSLFGVPTAYGSDAERAVNAAIAMQEEIKKFAQEIGVNIEMRVGINSGEMIYGEIPGKTTVTGDAVNTTQRLASIAEPGKILISDSTAKLVEGKILTRPLSPLKLKGKKEEVLAFEVIRTAKRIYPAFLSSMVGRDKELAKLKEFFSVGVDLKPFGLEPSMAKPVPTFAVITGETGIGKSKIVFELQGYLDKEYPQLRVIITRCAPYRTFIYQPLTDLIRELLGIEKIDPIATIMRKIEKQALPDDPLSKHFLGFFFGIKFTDSPLDHLTPETTRQTAFVTLKNLLEETTNKEQFALIFEDIHYADSGTADFLEFLTQTDFNHRMIILLAGRPEGFVDEIKNGRRKGNWNVIELMPLSKQESRTLIKSFFRQKEIEEGLMQTLIQRTGGNPLFIEEFIKDFKEKVFSLKEPEVSLPNSLWVLLEARMDSLAPTERALLRIASVIGIVFWKKILERLAKNGIEKELTALTRKGFIYEQYSSQILNDTEYIFSPELLREAAYKTILKKQRKELHTETLDYIEEKYQKKEIGQGLYLYLTACHSEYAEEYNKSAEFYEKLGDNAKERYAHQEAINFYEQAIEIWTEKLKDTKRTGEIIKKQAESQILLGMYDQAIENYKKLETIGDKKLKISALIGLAEVYNRRGKLEKSLLYSTEAKEMAERMKLKELEALALHFIGYGYMGRGAYDKALEFTEKAQKIYKSLISETDASKEVKRGTAKNLNRIGTIKWRLGEYNKALNFYEQSLKIVKQSGDKMTIASTLNNIGLIHGDQGEYDKALGFYKESIAIAREIGYKHGTAIALNNIGTMHEMLGDTNVALESYNQSIKIFQEIGDKNAAANTLGNIGRIEHHLGNYEKVLSYLNQILEIQKEIDKEVILTVLVEMGTIYYERGDYDTGLNYQKEAEKIIKEIGVKWVLVHCLNLKARLYIEIKEFSKAVESLNEALTICEELKLKSEMCDTLSLLSQTIVCTSTTKDTIQEAKAYLERARKIAEECKSKEAKSNVLYGYAKLYLFNREYKLAKKAVEELHAILKEIKWRDFALAETLYLEGIILIKLGEKEEAKKCLSNALSMSEKMGLKSLITKIQALSTF